jgi:hypothetical protein
VCLVAGEGLGEDVWDSGESRAALLNLQVGTARKGAGGPLVWSFFAAVPSSIGLGRKEHAPPPPSAEAKQRRPEVSGRFILLNPGSAELPPEQTESRPSAEPPPPDQSVMRRQRPMQGARRGDRSVLVVVRRSGPPYDT